MAFIRELQRLSPLVRVETLCDEHGGPRRPPPRRRQARPRLSPNGLKADKRMVVYIQANIHAGEVEGKEASLMLVRDIVLGPAAPYLDKLVLLIAPIFNADGNERISPENRSDQPGPRTGRGRPPQRPEPRPQPRFHEAREPRAPGPGPQRPRPLGPGPRRGLPHDRRRLPRRNGDLVLAAEPERRPAPPRVPAGDDAPGHQRDHEGQVRDPRPRPTAMFRDWKAPEKGWETFEPQPRYVTNYIGLRNRLSILDENYVHADFKTRVLGNYAFLRAILDYAAEHADEIVRLVADADRRTVRRGLAPARPTTGSASSSISRPLPEPITVHGYETEISWNGPGTWPELKKTDRKKIYTVPYFADYRPQDGPSASPSPISCPRPHAEVVGKLLQHGIVGGAARGAGDASRSRPSRPRRSRAPTGSIRATA